MASSDVSQLNWMNDCNVVNGTSSVLKSRCRDSVTSETSTSYNPGTHATTTTTNTGGIMNITDDMGNESTVNFLHHETCVIFDWDDTLNPSSFIDRRKLMARTRSYNDLTPDLKNIFSEISAAVEEVLTLAKNHGTVIIITNAQTGWVEMCVRKFMPNLKNVLMDIKVVSARSKFESLFPGDPLCWKGAAFSHELKELQELKGNSLKNIISFGDSLEERTAVKVASQQLKSNSKSIKFLEDPSPRQICQQLSVVTSSLGWITQYSQELDILLTINAPAGDLHRNSFASKNSENGAPVGA